MQVILLIWEIQLDVHYEMLHKKIHHFKSFTKIHKNIHISPKVMDP